MSIYGYMYQNDDFQANRDQRKALVEKKCEDIVVCDYLNPNEELNDLLDKLQKGDVVVVWQLHCFGHMKKILHVMMQIQEKEASLIVCHDEINTSTKHGQLFMEALRCVIKVERTLQQEKTRLGLAKAREMGIRLGRPKIPETIVHSIVQLKAKGHSYRRIAEECNVSIGSVYKYVQLYSQAGNLEETV